MKKLRYSLGLVFMTLVISCTDFVDPAIPYSDFETGVYLRTITPPTSFNFFALSSANFTLTAEVVDDKKGTSVEEVEVFVKRRRGAALTTEVPLTTIPGTAFTSSADTKYTRANISIPVTDALTAMGFTTADITGGDFIEFRLALTDKQGRVFTNTNLSADAASGVYYSSPFFYRVAVVCPSAIAGTYDAETDWVDYYSVAGSNSYTVNLTAVSGVAGRYNLADLSGGMEPIVWSNAPVAATINDVCGQITLNAAPYAYAYFIDGAGNTLQPVGAKSNVNTTTGVITIYWINAFDEHGVTVLTPQ